MPNPTTGTTGTNFDSIIDMIWADTGLTANTSQGDIIGGTQAADAMNTIIVTAIAANGLFDDGLISINDVYTINTYIRANFYDEWVVHHGDDEGNIETGYHLVQDDGGTSMLEYDDLVDSVFDGLYHLGFEINNGIIYNEDGNANATVGHLAHWLTWAMTGGSSVYFGTGRGEFISGANLDDEIFAGHGADNVVGNTGNDTLHGQRGDDLVSGGAGNDNLFGGLGHDEVNGGDGDDNMYGGIGNDLVIGGDGNDALHGKQDQDTIYGGAGNDRAFGGAGHDWIDGGTGHDYIRGGLGNDVLVGNDGNDRILGQFGQDTLEGGEGNDTLNGNQNDDRVMGGNGNDNITGGGGNDDLIGGRGADVFVFGAFNNGDDTIWDFSSEEGDLIILQNNVEASLSTQDGTDTLVTLTHAVTGASLGTITVSSAILTMDDFA